MVGYLLQPIIQIENSDGKPLEGGKVYVYKLGITPPVLADTYFDFQGHLNTNPIILDSLGHCTIIAEDDTAYDVIIKNKDDELQFSIHNATVMGGSGEIVIENPEVSVVAGEGIAVSSSRGLDGVITYTVALGASVISHLNDIDVNIVNLQNEDIDIHNDIDVANTNIQNNSNAITQISTNLANTMNTVISNTSRIEALENAEDTTYRLPLKKENNVVSNNGRDLTVTGDYAWAEGDGTKAIGNCSHASGEGTIARANAETAIGQYNLDEAGYIFQVGIGSSTERKDAFQIDTNGTINYLYNNTLIQLKPVTSRNVYVVATISTNKTMDDQPSDYWYDDYYLPIQPGETFNGCLFFTAPTTDETSNSGKYVSFVGHITDEQHNYYNDIYIPECSVRTTYQSAPSIAEWTARGCVPISFTNDSDKNLRFSCGFGGNLLKNNRVNVYITGTITA